MLAVVVAPQEPWVVSAANAEGGGRGLCLPSWGCQSVSLEWFIPEFTAPTEILQPVLPLTQSPFPCSGMEGRMGGRKDHRLR